MNAGKPARETPEKWIGAAQNRENAGDGIGYFFDLIRDRFTAGLPTVKKKKKNA